jgi:tetratricopeptide (TPR) repeat protein
MVHSLVDFNMHIPANAMTLFALAGLGLRPAHTDGGGKSRGFFDKKITAKRVAVVAAVLAAAGMTATFYTARAYYPALAAELAIGVKSLEECRARLESAARANPLDDTITVHRAFAYDLMGRYQESYLLYQQAIKMQPYNGYFRKLLGLHLWRRGELGKAREAFIAAAECPHGADDAKKAMEELERILNEPAPAPAKLKGKNPPRARPIEIDPNPEIIP